MWVHSGGWKSHAAISYIGVHNAWSFASCGVECHLFMPDTGNDSATEEDLRGFYGLEPDPHLIVHRVRLKRHWWHLRHPYFAHAEEQARALRQSGPLLVLTREQRFLATLARLVRRDDCRGLFETHFLYADQGWRTDPISRGDRKRGALERTYLPRISGIVAITSDQLKLYQTALPGLRGIAASLGAKTLALDADDEERRQRRCAAYIGHLLTTKGVPRLLGTAQQLAQHDVRLALFGGTPEDVARVGAVAANVSCTPFLPPADMFKAVAQRASLGVVALEENFCNRHLTCPVKALDFLALGMPVVASDLPSTREVLGNAGIFFPAGDTARMVAEISRLLDDPDLYRKHARLARERGADLSWPKRARRILDWVGAT